jgi:hypothetical protein
MSSHSPQLVHVHELIKLLSLPNNDVRRSAETQLEELKKQPDFLFQSLIHWMRHAEDPSVSIFVNERILSTLVLRMLVERDC